MTDLKFAKYVLFFPKTCVNCQKKGGGENYLGKGCTLMYIYTGYTYGISSPIHYSVIMDIF